MNETKEEYLEWYAGGHAHDILNLPGVHSVRSYRNLFGGPYITGITEVDSPEVLGSAEYRAIGANDPMITSGKSDRYKQDHSRTLYREGAMVAGPPRPTNRRLDSPWLGICRFSDAAEVDEQKIARAFAPITEASVTARVFAVRQGGKHPTTPSLDPEWGAFVEFEDPPSEADYQLLRRCTATLGGAEKFPVSVLEYIVYHRKHRVPENTNIHP